MFERLKHIAGLYYEVTTTAWKHRHENPVSRRQRSEAGFLPAMLEVQETSPHPLAAVTMWLIILFFIIAIIWMIVGKIDIVVSATGRVLPDNRIKVIQSAQSGVVEEIFVKDGDVVQAGDELLALDSTLTDADEVSIENELLAMRLEAEMTRLLAAESDFNRVPALAGNQQLADVSAVKMEHHQQSLDSLFMEQKSRIGQLRGEIVALRKDLLIEEQGSVDAGEQLQQEQEMVRYKLLAEERQVEKLQALLPIAESRYESFQLLHGEDVISRVQLQQSQEEYISLQKDLEYKQSQLKEIEVQSEARQLEYRQRTQQYSNRAIALREKIAVRERALTLERNRFRREMDERRTVAERKRVELEQSLVKARQSERHHRISAPVSGIVQQLAIHTRGAVVQPAQALLVIVPEERELEIEALVANRDIGFLSVGQEVEIKVDAFPYTKYGLLSGEVSHLSADAIEDERRGLIYQARIRLHDNTLIVNGEKKQLAPGMSVVVEVKTGQRRVIEFFLAPLIQHGKESLKER